MCVYVPDISRHSLMMTCRHRGVSADCSQNARRSDSAIDTFHNLSFITDTRSTVVRVSGVCFILSGPNTSNDIKENEANRDDNLILNVTPV